MKINKRSALYILLALSAIIVVLFLCHAPNLILQHQIESKAYPDTGTFYCEELDAYLTFDDNRITLTMANGSQEDIYVHPAGRFCSDDSKINMWYKWNSRENHIEIRVISFPGAIEDAVYHFSQ